MEKVTRRIRVFGRVQGVFFRESMRQRAAELGVTGWVRNRADGSVEAVLHGPPQAVEALVQWAHRGPARASVERVDVEPAEGVFEDFRRLPDA